MKLLIIGGTVFLGRALVETALSRGHEVTLFNRGQHNADLFPGVEKLRGDRDGNLAALKGRRWDAVIDTCGYFPRIVGDSAKLLANAVDVYTFISTISVYQEMKHSGEDETFPVGMIADPTVEQITGETYGPLKALCEQAVETHLPGRALIIRPGLIVGPWDRSDRFTYWPVRIGRGGEVMVPGRPDRGMQVIDVRDLAAFTLTLTEQKVAGIFNATGPATTLTMQDIVETCREVSGSDTTFTWVDSAFVLEQKVGPWMELPLWEGKDETSGLMSVSIARALKAGLTCRPLSETVRDTLAWNATRPADEERRAGLKPEKEQAVLAAWHARKR